MQLEWTDWKTQEARWPQAGRHILAQHDDASVVVYQAYRPDIAEWAVTHQQFGGPWSFERMSRIKPNFLWMMYRCGWASKEGQERVLAVRITREGFDTVLARAVESSYRPECGLAFDDWRAMGKRADVRLQWDPDHAPGGAKCERRAIQLGLRGETLRAFAVEWTLSITDITEAVTERATLRSAGWSGLTTPAETVYLPADPAVATRIRLDGP